MNKIKLDIAHVSKIMIEHSRFLEAVNAMEKCYLLAENNSDPYCVAIVGETRTGKSRTLEYFENKYPRIRHTEYLEVPVLRIKVNAKPTIKGLVELLLHSIGDPLFNKGTENERTERLIILLKSAKTRVIMLDEFQHFSDQGGNHVQHHVADWLKLLVDSMRIGLVISGLNRSINIINTNEQLVARFNSPILMKSFEWDILNERNEFLAFLNELQKCLEPYKVPQLDSDEMGIRMYCATGGYIGYIIKILNEAVVNSSLNNNPVITLRDLNLAYKKSMWGESARYKDPFSRGFINKNITKADLDVVESVKTEYIPQTANEVLSAT